MNSSYSGSPAWRAYSARNRASVFRAVPRAGAVMPPSPGSTISHQNRYRLSAADARASRARPRPPGSRRGSASSAPAGTPGSVHRVDERDQVSDLPAQRRRVRAGDVVGQRELGSREREQRPALGGVEPNARASASSTSGEGLMSRPCSSHVYQDTPTPANAASSSRLRPGVRRCRRCPRARCLRATVAPAATQKRPQLFTPEG